jgi:ADP-ribose pyrophosphatase YjhB (NUDIX family)
VRRRFPLRNRLVATGYRVFYLIPHKWRTRLVRLVWHKYVVGAVVLVFDSEAAPGQERLLVLRQPPGRGWTLPAGLLERGETPVAGACREAAEETGIVFAEHDLTPAVPNAMVHTKGRWVDVVFTAQVPASTTTLRVDGAEVWEAAWHPVDELPTLTPATARLLGHYGIGPEAS